MTAYPSVPIALLKGFDRLATSGVKVAFVNGSSAASSNELMLKVLSDIPHAELWRRLKTGVAVTNALKYFSLKRNKSVF